MRGKRGPRTKQIRGTITKYLVSNKYPKDEKSKRKREGWDDGEMSPMDVERMNENDDMMAGRKKVELETKISGMLLNTDAGGTQSLTLTEPGMIPIGGKKKMKLGANYGRMKNFQGIKNFT